MTRIAKIITLLSFCFLSIDCLSQSTHLLVEQTAFNFYKSELMKGNVSQKRLEIAENLESINYLHGNCLKDKFETIKNPKLAFDNSNSRKLNFKKIDTKKFKVVKKVDALNKKNFYLKVSMCYKFNGRLFVSINETVDNHWKRYTFEFNNAGKIIDWCITGEGDLFIEY